MKSFDVIVIGGGSAGLMAALSASAQKAKVLLIEKKEKLGRKLAISGGGRCNVTNRKTIEDFIAYMPGNGKFLYAVLQQFSPEHIINLFENWGIPLKEENDGRMFPVTDKAQSVVQALVQALHQQNVHILTHTHVKEVLFKSDHVYGIRDHADQLYLAPAVIIATGGKSVPQTGSTGDGYEWAEKAGHTVTKLYPTEVPIVSNEPWIQQKIWQGISLRNIELSVQDIHHKKVVTHLGDMIFTHFGLSGPAALRCSQFVVKTLEKFKVSSIPMVLNFQPTLQEELFLSKLENHRGKSIKNALSGTLPERCIPLVLEKAQVKDSAPVHTLSKRNKRDIYQLIQAFPIQVHGTLSLEKAFITGGGVHVKEIVPKTMASKKMTGLYFCGEVLDIHGYTGGYNITAAFSTGHAAGKAAALHAKSIQ